MKKDLIFSPILLVLAILLCLLKVTGMSAHIAISVVGVLVLILYTITTKKEWKIPALEIFMRFSYGIALISGIVVKVKYIAFIGILHKIFAILFIIMLIALFVYKLIKSKNMKNKASYRERLKEIIELSCDIFCRKVDEGMIDIPNEASFQLQL